MKILVVEDNEIHRASAVETLAGHEVTIVKTFDEAMDLMSVEGFPFEAVLTDLMMPMSKKKLLPEFYNPKEQVPYGFVIMLCAAQCGARFVAMVTDTNHHKGAMSAAIDNLDDHYSWAHRPRLVINGAKVLISHQSQHDGQVKDWGKVLAELTA